MVGSMAAGQYIHGSLQLWHAVRDTFVLCVCQPGCYVDKLDGWLACPMASLNVPSFWFTMLSIWKHLAVETKPTLRYTCHLSAGQDTQSLQVNSLSFSEPTFYEASQLVGIFCGSARLKVRGRHRAELHIESQGTFIWPVKQT